MGSGGSWNSPATDTLNPGGTAEDSGLLVEAVISAEEQRLAKRKEINAKLISEFENSLQHLDSVKLQVRQKAEAHAVAETSESGESVRSVIEASCEFG